MDRTKTLNLKPFWAAGLIVVYVAVCVAILCSAVRPAPAGARAGAAAPVARAILAGR